MTDKYNFSNSDINFFPDNNKASSNDFVVSHIEKMNQAKNLYHKLDDLSHVSVNDRIIANGLFTPKDVIEHNDALIQKFNEENKTDNYTADFAKLNWGKKLVYDDMQAFDGTNAYVCRESANIPLVEGLSINIVKTKDGFTYSVLDKDNNVLSSTFTKDEKEIANKLKANEALIAKQPEDLSLRTVKAIHDNIDEIKLAYLERVKRRQQELLAEKGEKPSSLKVDDSMKFSQTTISKEDMAAYIAKNSKQNQ